MRFVLAAPAALMILLVRTVDVAAQQLPPWWETISEDFDGINLALCKKRQDPPNPPRDGARCSWRPKTCYFGNQRCPGVQSYPETECICNKRVWTCQDVKCKVTTPAPVTAAPVTEVPSGVPSANPTAKCTCLKGYTVTPNGKRCQRVESVDALFNGKSTTACAAKYSRAYGWRGARFPGDDTVQNSFFNSRLNDISLWACGEDDNELAGEAPFYEWIGFSHCIEIPEDEEYVIGIACDDQFRLKVDGDIAFENLNLGNQDPFNYWWMVPISLKSGYHIIELEGLNLGHVAAFGAEIYGPFDQGATDTDAKMAVLPYEDNIVWSTGDLIGTEFVSGTCPVGTAINTCETEITCTAFDETACNGSYTIVTPAPVVPPGTYTILTPAPVPPGTYTIVTPAPVPPGTYTIPTPTPTPAPYTVKEVKNPFR